MERRKILLGSGAAIATVLAGCSSDQTGDDSSSSDDGGSGDSSDGAGDGTGDGNGNSTGDGTGNSTGDGNGTGNGDGNSEAKIPGLKRDKLKLNSEKLTIENVTKSGKELNVVATSTTTDPETLFAELESLGNDMKGAITDPKAFAAAVDSITWVFEKDGAKVMSFYVDVTWAVKYINGELSQSKFVDRVLSTVGESQ
ncbi:hypothetical protein [Natrinema sp. 74]|uniref:hypothetical protein n=1 Tax=Natrinema sp. 74 TaxID=3384159 RepID=UPI0038D4EE6F